MGHLGNNKVCVVALAVSGRFFTTTTGPLEILETAADLAECRGFASTVVSADNKPISGRGSISIQVDERWQNINAADVLLVGSIGDPEETLDCIPNEVIEWVKKLYQNGARVVGIDTGIFVLAQGGLLDDCDAIMHPYFSHLFRKKFPGISLLEHRKTLINDRIYLSSGVYTYQGLIFQIVEEIFGSQVKCISHQLCIANESDDTSLGYSDVRNFMQHKDALIHKIQKGIVSVDSRTMSVGELAAEAHLSERQLKRRFKDATGITPLKFIQLVRLSFAKELLRNTKLSVEEVGRRVSYEDVRFFRQIFKRENGLSPQEYRKNILASLDKELDILMEVPVLLEG
ncbi:GlxA family transcriptional regulator [Vibrio splendidus]